MKPFKTENEMIKVNKRPNTKGENDFSNMILIRQANRMVKGMPHFSKVKS